MLVQATDIEQECLLLNPVFNLRYVKQKECHTDSLELVDGDVDGKPMAVDVIKKENQENMENKYNTREPKVAMDSCSYGGPPHSNVASIQKEVEGNITETSSTKVDWSAFHGRPWPEHVRKNLQDGNTRNYGSEVPCNWSESQAYNNRDVKEKEWDGTASVATMGSMNDEDIEKAFDTNMSPLNLNLNNPHSINQNTKGTAAANNERSVLDDEWKRFHEAKTTLMRMMESLGELAGQGRFGSTAQAERSPPEIKGDLPLPHTNNLGTNGLKNKNEQKKERARQKKEEKEAQEQRRIEQERAQRESSQALSKYVIGQERNRTRQSKKQDGFKKEKKLIAKDNSWKVKGHSIKEGGKVMGKFQYGKEKELWISMEDIWEPCNIATYVPAWREYCKRKNLPANWGYSGSSSTNDELNGTMDGVLESTNLNTTTDSIVTDTTSKRDQTDKEEEAEPAVCYGHAIDSRGWVHMKLRWNDTGDESFGVVRHVMNNRWERKAFGNTWIEYCNSQGIKDDGFRMMGRSVVKNIEGHDWADCGRPKARINWMHGGITTEMVKDAREPKMADTNGFKAAWEVYCDKIGNTEEGFVRGNVDKSHRVPAKKKMRRSK